MNRPKKCCQLATSRTGLEVNAMHVQQPRHVHEAGGNPGSLDAWVGGERGRVPEFCARRGCTACPPAPAAGDSGKCLLSSARAQSAARPSGKPPRSIGVAVVESEPGVREMMSTILSASSDFYCCGFFMTAGEALRTVPSLDVDIVLVALAVPDICGIQCAHRLASNRCGSKTILILPPSCSALAPRAFSAGIDACLVSPSGSDGCPNILRLLASRLAVPSANQQELWTCPPIKALTTREERILHLLEQGLPWKCVRSELNMSDALTNKLERRLFRKLGVHSRGEAVYRWRRLRPAARTG